MTSLKHPSIVAKPLGLHSSRDKCSCIDCRGLVKLLDSFSESFAELQLHSSPFFGWLLKTSNLYLQISPFSLFNFQPTQGGIISKLRRRLTVQGESETIDGVLPNRAVLGKQESDKVEDVSLHDVYM